ncbi:transposase, partial [Aeromonas caviae]
WIPCLLSRGMAMAQRRCSTIGISYLGHYIRQHWRIENSQHYILDVVFNEDASRIAMEDAVENMALFRRFVLNIVKQSNCGARSQRNKLKRAGWNDDYRAQLFFG